MTRFQSVFTTVSNGITACSGNENSRISNYKEKEGEKKKERGWNERKEENDNSNDGCILCWGRLIEERVDEFVIEKYIEINKAISIMYADLFYSVTLL